MGRATKRSLRANYAYNTAGDATTAVIARFPVIHLKHKQRTRIDHFRLATAAFAAHSFTAQAFFRLGLAPGQRMGRALAGDVATFRARDRRLSVVSMS